MSCDKSSGYFSLKEIIESYDWHFDNLRGVVFKDDWELGVSQLFKKSGWNKMSLVVVSVCHNVLGWTPVTRHAWCVTLVHMTELHFTWRVWRAGAQLDNTSSLLRTRLQDKRKAPTALVFAFSEKKKEMMIFSIAC